MDWWSMPGADKSYLTAGFAHVSYCPQVLPHLAQNTTNSGLPIDGRAIRHPGYRTSYTPGKCIEEVWAADICYIPIVNGLVELVAIIVCHRRKL